MPYLHKLVNVSEDLLEIHGVFEKSKYPRSGKLTIRSGGRLYTFWRTEACNETEYSYTMYRTKKDKSHANLFGFFIEV